MPGREILGLDYDQETKNKILEAAIKFFAQRGFYAVTMKDIANEVGIKVASIYNHYDSKEALLEDALSFFTRGYRHYFEWLTQMNASAESLEEVMDNMFNDEFVNMLDPIGFLGISLAMKEQHSNESARRCVFDLFYEHSIESMKADFDRLIEKGVIVPCDTKTIAMIFMFCVMVSNDIRLHEHMGAPAPIACKEIYTSLKKHLTSALGGEKIAESKRIRCSFCRKPREEVDKIIVASGRNINICNECVRLCVDILDEAASEENQEEAARKD